MSRVRAPLDFLREVKVELDKVVWPSRAQTLQLTVVVIVVTVIVGFFIGAIDYVLAQILQYLTS